MSTKTGVCNFCGTGCGHLVRVEEDAIRSVFPSPSHPVGRGRLCVRGWHIHELLNTEDRLVRPLIRRNGILSPATWDEALDEAATKLAGFRGDEIGFWVSPRSSNEDVYSLVRLARSTFRSPHISLISDAWYRSTAEVLRQGTGWFGALGTLTDLRTADFILVVGTDLTRQNPIAASEIHFAARSGARVVSLSSRATQMAKLSTTHLQLRPGSKRMILAAMAKALIEEGKADLRFIAERTEGYEGFRSSLAALDWKDIEDACGLPHEEIREASLRLAGSPRAVAVFSTGITGLEPETVALIYNLFLAAGRIGRDGCGILPLTGISNLAGANDMGASPVFLPGWRRLPDPSAEAAFKDLWKADLESRPGRSVEDLLAAASSPLKALVVVDHDPEINLYESRIRELDFVLYLGSYVNPFTDLADVVLPTTTYAEADGTYTNTDRRIQLNRRKTGARFESRPAWRIYADLAARRGERWPYASSSEIQAEIARAVPAYAGAEYPNLEAAFGGLQWPCGGDRPRGTPRFDLEDAPGPLRFLPSGPDFSMLPLPAEYPFRLMAGKSYFYWHQNTIMKTTFIPRREYNALLLLYPRGLVEVNPADAAALGLRDKRPVRIVSERAAMEVAVRVTGDVPPGTVYAPYFIGPMIPGFLAPHAETIERGEDALIPVRLEAM